MNVNKFEYFNPRSHERSDDTAPEGIRQYSISIHAPTRGATEQRRKLKSWFEFQSTLPREERLFFPLALPFKVCISIHAPTRGATFLRLAAIRRTFISIHAPTRGATLFHSLSNTVTFISIHAPTRGATK